ncbi:MAG: DUF1366 domain-containing protein [Gemella sp.]|nr:MAG: DUF1366 domain-containing protein [Gemella sp.]
MYKVSWTSAVFKDAEIVKTRVQINSEDNLTIITKILDGNHTQKSEDELIFLVLEQFYQDTYPNRAENEKFSKVDEKLKLVDTKLAELDKVKKELDITQGSLMDLITQIGGGALAETENQNKGGENNDGNVIRN